jgi:Fic family protein
MGYIHEQPGWPDLKWNEGRLAGTLAVVRFSQGRLLGRIEAMGFPFRDEAELTTLTRDVVKSSAIEGERLNPAEVRSSIARRLGMDGGSDRPASRAFRERANSHPMNERQKIVLKRLVDGFRGNLNTSRYAKLAKCSEDTALRDIKALCEWGILVRNPAGGRSTSYAPAI